MKNRFSALHVLLLALVLFIGWANVFKLDETIRARGKVVTEGRIQVVQSPEGGVLRELEVREGDVVQAGQVLAIMDSEMARASADEVYAEIHTSEIAKIRAEYELLGEVPDFGELGSNYPQVAAAELALFRGNLAAKNSELEFATQSLNIAARELEIQNQLFSNGDVSRTEVAQAEREVINAQNEIVNIGNKYKTKALEDIVAIEQKISVLKFRLAAREKSLEFSRLRAPQDGVVTNVATNTLGGVLRSGDELLRISPTGKNLIPEVRFAPQDVGHLKVGQEVMVQFDAFPSTIYGALNATLTHISADTISEVNADGRNETFYRGMLQFSENQINGRIDLAQVKPGMEVTVDVKTGKRTVMTYIAKPILRAFSGALREP